LGSGCGAERATTWIDRERNVFDYDARYKGVGNVATGEDLMAAWWSSERTPPTWL
jgi:hypothetical protein